MCLKIQHLNPEKSLLEPRLPCVAALKSIEVKLELLTDIDMLLIVEKEVWGGIFHLNHWCEKANNKYNKYYDKDTESSYLK